MFIIDIAQCQIQGFFSINRNDVNKLKEGEIEKTKTYLALCWSKEPLSQEQFNKLNDMKVVKTVEGIRLQIN
jgi:tRNA U54 and U55 pseudouridine synthase Pus10